MTSQYVWIWAYLTTFSRFWAFIWKLGFGSASKWKVRSESASKWPAGSGFASNWQAGSGSAIKLTWAGSATLFPSYIGRGNNMNWYSKRNISLNASLVKFFFLDWHSVGRCFRGDPRPRTRRLQLGCCSLLSPSSRRDRHQDRHHSGARQVTSCSLTQSLTRLRLANFFKKFSVYQSYWRGDSWLRFSARSQLCKVSEVFLKGWQFNMEVFS